MEIISLTPDRYPQWDKFCLDSDDAWFWHTTDWLEYSLNYKPSLRSESRSFMVCQDNDILAVCPIILEWITDGGNKIPELSMGGLPCSVPAIANDISKSHQKKVLKQVFKEIDRIAGEGSVQRVSFRFSPLAPSFFERIVKEGNFLTLYGCIDISLSTQVIDLNKTIEELWTDLRHGHRYDISRGKKVLEVDMFDSKNIEKGVFDTYIELHHKAAGRITRPRETFEMMFEWIKSGNGALAGVRMGEKYVGFALLTLYKSRAYYGSGCMDSESPEIPIGHFMQWCVIKWLKEQGYDLYEIGFQYYAGYMHSSPSDKEMNISKFKRGFGGFTTPLFIGEKFYSKEYFVKIHTDRIHSYALFLDDLSTQSVQDDQSSREDTK